jgi:hypothetical protein
LETIDAVSAQLDLMQSKGFAIWDRRALNHDAEWQNLRAIAADCLCALGWPTDQ